MAYVVVDGISVRFGGLQALDSCSFSIKEGEITCLVGPNGAGKTTIFNAVTGFLKPDAGTVRFRDRLITGLKPQAIVRAGIARTFQNLRLFTEMSVLDNLMLALPEQFGEEPLTAIFRPIRTQKLGRERGRVAERALAETGLTARAHDLVRNLSYGEQKMLSIARVLATGADLLLLDEPASGLDAEALDGAMALLRRLQAEGKTLLVVEHNTRVVQRIADTVMFLHQGRLLAQGSPDEITRDPHLTEIYFGGVLG
ncbi:MAG TPA: ABC transporter ATP-binding protein [Magnetospirillaceae bacterium]|jgi:ABC-type branched-subunit amino acid transport system ATPase component